LPWNPNVHDKGDGRKGAINVDELAATGVADRTQGDIADLAD
jgi:hypothetical protein